MNKCLLYYTNQNLKLLTMDTSATTTMKNAAKRDSNCELQNSVNHRNFERTLRSWISVREHAPLSVGHQNQRKNCGFRFWDVWIWQV